MKKYVVFLLALVLTIIPLSACDQVQESEQSGNHAAESVKTMYKAGTYAAESNGMVGPLKVEVTFSDSRIEAVNVVEQNETVRIGEVAIKTIPEQIVEYQSLDFDTVSSATVTSNAIRLAVEDCVKQAGGDVTLLQAVKIPVEPAKDEEFTYDVVVVGGGLSGLSAAVSAMQAGASVALIEKEPFLGGTSAMAEGYMFSVGKDTPDDLYNLFLERAKEAPTSDIFPDKAMLRTLADHSQSAEQMIKSTGLNLIDLKPFTVIADPGEGYTPAVDRSGYKYIDYLSQYILDNGGKIFVNTPGTKLLTNETGTVVGIESDSKNGKKTFHANSVVLASGDFGRNPELVKKYIPESIGCYTITAKGNTGDGIEMALEVGAAMYEDQYMQGGPLIFNPYDVYRGSYSNPEFLLTSILVSLDGERRVAEDKGTRPIHYSYLNGEEPDGAFSIMDANIVSGIKNIDELIAATSESSVIKAYKADTIEELATKAGMDPSVLAATVTRYNELVAGGKDTDFGKSSEHLVPIEEGPFYAVRGYAISRGTLGGIQTSTNAEVIDEQGQPIDGLYAAGTISSRAFFGRTYHGGSALGISYTMGHVAGTNAVEK